MLNESTRARLVRVLKNIRRKGSDGSVRTHEQAFHVRQAAPGDRYAQTSRSQLPSSPTVPMSGVTSQPEMSPVDQQVMLSPEEPVEFRFEVHPLQMPWALPFDGGEEDGHDPIPPEIRKRFDPENRSNRNRDPVRSNVPLFSVKPGEDMLWGAMEAELLNRLRSGIVVATRPSTSSSQAFLAKIESNDGVVERAYLRFDSLMNQQVFDLYGDMYGIKNDGFLAKRGAASYELAKAAGLDDLIPPTVSRIDEHSGLEPILSAAAAESLAVTLGISVNALRDKLGDSASVELWTEDATLIWQQPWYSRFASIDGDALNDFYARLEHDAPEVRVALIRGAVFDFLAWNGNRTWAEVIFCPEPRHPVHLVHNELTFPDPVAMGAAFLDYRMSYHDGCPSDLQYMPMLWSDLVSMAAMRGFDREARLYEEIAVDCARRLRGQRLTELIRSLGDHGVKRRSVAAVLVRVAFLRYGSHVVMRNPLIVAEYFSSLMTGDAFDPGFDIDMDEVERMVDETMSDGGIYDFSLRAAMEEDDDD